MKTLKSTGLVRRFGCGVVRETKTVLAVLAMLASVLAWGSAPVRAQDNDGDLGSHRVRVLAQNMYIGASLHDLITATTVKQIKDAITALLSHSGHQAPRTGGCDGGRNCKTAPGFRGAVRGMEVDRGRRRQDGPAGFRN